MSVSFSLKHREGKVKEKQLLGNEQFRVYAEKISLPFRIDSAVDFLTANSARLVSSTIYPYTLSSAGDCCVHICPS